MRIIPFPLDFISQFTLIVDWEQRKLGELIESANYGLNASASEYDGENKYIRITDIDEVTREFSQNNLTSPNVKLLLADNYLLRTDDILFARTGASVGKSYIYNNNDGKVYYAGFLIRVRVDNKNNALFIFQYTLTEKYNNFVRITSQRSGQPGINVNEYLNLSIMTPKLDEQAKIGELLKKLDNTIALHQRKLEALKRLKEAYLQNMFPKKEESAPKLRFTNFSEVWEQNKLGEVAIIVGGGTPSTTNPDFWGGSIDWYSPVEIGHDTFVNSSNKKITNLGLQKSSAKLLPAGTVLFTSRAGIGNTAILTKEGTTNQGFQSIVPIENLLDSYFIYSRTKELKRYGERNGAGSTFTEVSGRQMAKMKMLIPTLNEQILVGKTFKILDNLITLQLTKLDHLRLLKKSYLQKMFI